MQILAAWSISAGCFRDNSSANTTRLLNSCSTASLHVTPFCCLLRRPDNVHSGPCHTADNREGSHAIILGDQATHDHSCLFDVKWNAQRNLPSAHGEQPNAVKSCSTLMQFKKWLCNLVTLGSAASFTLQLIAVSLRYQNGCKFSNVFLM